MVSVVCLAGSRDGVSLKDRSSVLRSRLVDHPPGGPCRDSDAGSISVFTVEGKSCLSLEFGLM